MLVAGAADSRADEPEPPRIPVGELPPFPEVMPEQDKVLGVTVIGAQAVEEDVVVGASKREQSLGSVASAVTVISGDTLRRFAFRTVAEALDTVAGLYIVDDRMMARVGIRGVQLLGDANTHILVLVDGSPLNEPWGQYADVSYAVPVSIDDIARLEVIRGPVSSIYGTNAFFGIINIVTVGADKASTAHARLGVGQFNEVNGTAAFAAGGVDRQVRGHVRWTQRGGEDSLEYPVFAGTLDDVDGVSALDAGIVAHYDQLFAQVRGFRRDRDLTGAPYDAAIGEPGNRNTDEQILVEAAYAHELTDDVTVSARLYADRYRYVGTLVYDAADDFETEGNATWYGGELRTIADLSESMPRDMKLDITAGVAAELADTDSASVQIENDGTRIEAVDIDTSFNIAGIYAEVNAELTRRVAATAGVRYDRNSLFDNNLSPRAALFYKHDEKYGGKLLYAEGFRNPSIFEAFYDDGLRFRPGCAPQCENIGSTVFPELITSYEAVGWGRPLPGVKVRASLWRWEVENLIEKRRILDPESLTERLQFQNLAQLTSQGAEVEASYRDTRGWFGFGSISLNDVARDGDAAFNAPAVLVKLGVSSPRWLDRFHVSTDVSFIGARPTRDPANDADPWVGWNAVMYVPDYRGFDFTLGVRNILGLRADIPAQSDYDRQSPEIDVYVVPGPGREIFARVGYQY